jgi:3-oxoacyl-[acyl-carrier protein] reductase
MRLEGKVALITGSATGIGKATAIAFAREGAAVTVNYTKSQAEAQATLQQITEMGARAILVQADVSRENEVREMVARTLEAFGRIDFLINNAAITRFVAMDDLDALDDEAWDAIYAVNVKGSFYCARAVAPIMKKLGEGLIVNTSSVAGFTGMGSSIPYAASKAAVISLTKSLARVLGPEIRVNAVAPGFVPTRWNAGRESEHAGIIAQTPLGRLATPEDIAGVSVAFATDARFVTGAVVVVDGGRLMP